MKDGLAGRRSQRASATTSTTSLAPYAQKRRISLKHAQLKDRRLADFRNDIIIVLHATNALLASYNSKSKDVCCE